MGRVGLLALLLCAGIASAVTIEQTKGIDQSVDYASLVEYGPWDDRNYTLTSADIALLPEDDQYLANVPAFFKVYLRKEQPNLGAYYPRAAYQYFKIMFGGLVQDGVWHRSGLGKHYNPLPEDFADGKVPKHWPYEKAFTPDNETPLALNVAGNEVSVEFNPTNNMNGVAGSNQSGGQTMYYTNDGGLTWNLAQTNGSSCCDPTIDWSSDGSIVYQADLSSSIGVRAFRSLDQGVTWEAPVVITPSGSDKEFLHVDRSASSPHQDNIYITYHNGNVMQFVRSTNMGVSYEAPMSFGGEPTGIGSDITTDPAGNVYYFYPTLGNPSHIRMLKSVDGGVSFMGGIQVATLNGTFDFPVPSMETRRVFIYVSADVDTNTGDIYAAWTDEADDSAGTSASQNHAWVRVAKSTDQGATWTLLPIPHDTSDSVADGDAIDRYHPWLKVGENGVVHIGFYDTRHSTNRTGVDFYYTYSADGGASWEPEMRVSAETSPNLPDGQEWGDYNGLSVVLDRLAMTWTDNRSSNNPSGSDKVAMASSGVNPAGSPTYQMAASPDSFQICDGDTGLSTQVTVTGLLGYTEDVTLTDSGVPSVITNGGFNVNPVTPTGTSDYSFDAGVGATGSYVLTIEGEGPEVMRGPPTISRSVEVEITFNNAIASAIALTSPPDMDPATAFSPTFEWVEDPEAATYVLEISTDPGFGSILHSAMIDAPSSSYTLPITLDSSTTYYWRMRASNGCGTSTDSAVFSFTTAPQLGDCPVGMAPVRLFNFTFESGAEGWATSGTGNTWALSSINPAGGFQHWHADNSDSISDQRLRSPTIALPTTNSPLTLQFMNEQQLESNGTEACYDGGLLEVAENGGPFIQVADSEMGTDPYDGPINDGFSNPLSGLDAWCGDPQPYLNSIVNIDGYAGSDIRLRFRLGTDSSVEEPGWDIDDVRIMGCGPDEYFTDSFGDSN